MILSVINAVIIVVVVVMFSNCQSIFSGVIGVATGRRAWSMSWELAGTVDRHIIT